MFNLILLFLMNVILAYAVQSRGLLSTNGTISIKKDSQAKFFFFIIVLAFVFFAGLRTSYNDTGNYMYAFNNLVDTKLSFNDFFESYGGFEFFQSFIKRYISTDAQSMIFITSMLTNLLYLPFILKYSKHFSESIFWFCIEDFIFMMAGVKQAIAIGIALYAISAYLNEKRIKSILLLILAMTFHPYILCLVAIPFLIRQVWDFRTILVVICCFVLFMNIEMVFDFLSFIGKDYSDTNLNNYTINSARVLVESVPIIISIIYRNKINKSDSVILKLGINMQIISFAFIFMGFFVNPIFPGRMSIYFSMLSTIAIPEMLHVCWDDEKNGVLYKMIFYAFFFVYFLLDMTKLGRYSFTLDQFNHVSFSDFF